MSTSEPLTVVVPPEIAALPGLDDPTLDVVVWDGSGAPPPEAARAQAWVPPYAVGVGADWVRRTLPSFPALRLVQLLSAGVEPWPGLVPDGVALCSGKGIHGASTAELAVALTLALIRDLPRYAAQQREQVWRRHPPRGVEGENVLVLGAGDVGGRVATTLSALGATTHVVGRTEREGVLSLEAGRRLLPHCSVLVVALPLTDETRRLVDEAWLAALPDGAVVVNVARGAVLDQDALTAEVSAGRLRAGLDVTDPEPLPPGHPLWTLPGVIVTPHIGGGTEGWADRAAGVVGEQLRRLRAGKPPCCEVISGY